MKYGFIGCGNMGGAIARALRRQTDDILICDHSPACRAAAQPPLAPTLGELASEARLRGRAQWQIWERCGDCCRVPSQSRLAAVPALP